MQNRDELEQELEAWRRQPPPRLLLLSSGPDTSVFRRVASHVSDAIWLRPRPGGGPALVRGLLDDLAATSNSGDPPTRLDGDQTRRETWAAVWAEWRDRASSEPRRVWVLDARDDLPAVAWEAFARSWAGVRGQALPVRLMILVRSGGAERLAELPHDQLLARPADAWTWAESLDSWSVTNRVRAAAVFGSEDRFRTLVDPSHSLGGNVRSLVLSLDAPMATAALDRVRHAVQRPERYLRVAQAVATGATDWGTIRQKVGGLADSGQLGPYLRTLEELGIIRARRSLDASPRSRSTRYHMADPWLGFWFSCVLPSWSRLGTEHAEVLWQNEVEPRLDTHLQRTLPLLLSQWLRTLGARQALGSVARETGGLWGDGYDMPVSGTLETGAIVYGWTRWLGGSFNEATITAATRQLRATRYGFGRENRLKLFVQRAPIEHGLARLAARDPEMTLLSAEDLLAGAR